MKRFLHISILSLVLVMGATALSPVAHADCTLGQSCIPSSGGNGVCIEDSGGASNYCSAIAATNGGVDPNASPAIDPKAAATATTYGSADKDSPYNYVMIKIMELFAWLLGVAALTLNYAVFYTVVKMGSFVNSLPAIGLTWQILRDIGNIMLIFGFLAIGIATIVDLPIYGWGKTMLPMLLVGAVFLNFSLFISEAIIDTGNLFATQFYQQIVGGTLPTQSGGVLVTSSGATLTTANEGISNAIMNKLGLQTIYGNGVASQIVYKYPWTIGFMGIILFLIAAFVMFSLAFTLIARFIILIYLIILSPVGFAGLAIPKLQNSAHRWWAGIFEQSITAPVLLLTLYIALRVITDVNFLTGFGMQTTSDGAATGFVENANLPGFASFILSFLVAMGLLLAVVIFSKKLSAFGSDWASKAAGGLTFGATAFVGRRTVGRTSNYLARKVRSSSIGQSETGRLLANTFDRGAKASFDARAATTLGGLKAIGINAGDAQKGGYHGREEELIKARTDYAKTLKTTKAQKDESDKILKPLKKQEDEQITASKILIDQSKAEIKAQKERVQAARSSGDKTTFEAETKLLDSLTASHKELRETEAEKLEPIRKAIKDEEKRFKVAAQTKYGESLEKKRTLLRPYDVVTATGSARSEAAKKILKEAKKEDDEKLKELIEKATAEPAKPAAQAATSPAAGAAPH